MRIAIPTKTQKTNNNHTTLLILITYTLTACGIQFPTDEVDRNSGNSFNGERAYADVIYQVSAGPRIPGSPAHDQIVSWIQSELEAVGWDVDIQNATLMEHPVKNIIGQKGREGPWIILGAHYDSRLFADRDPDPEKANQPVPGANDGASGVAILLELARVLPDNILKQVWLVFFDAEDNGNITSWDWILGSRAFVQSLGEKPDAAIIIDMVGDANLEIYKERNSDADLTEEIWNVAASLGYEQFKSNAKFSMLDDHIPFLQAGIPAIVVIDFDYPYWHTSEDTPDKVSAESLKAVGDTLLSWLVMP